MAASYESPVKLVSSISSSPAVGFTGMLMMTQDTGSLYWWNGSAWALVSGSTVGGRRNSFNNEPASPSSYNDEFDSTSLNARWTPDAGLAAGTIDPTATLVTTATYDLTTFEGYLMFQGEQAATTVYAFSQSLTPATNATFFVKLVSQGRGSTGGPANVGASEAGVFMRLSNSGDANEEVGIGLRQTGAGPQIFSFVNNNGAVTSVTGAATTSFFGAIFKLGNVYYCYSFNIEGGTGLQAVLTKTGVTSFDTLKIDFSTSDDTVTPILGCDFFRYYPSVTMDLMNP